MPAYLVRFAQYHVQFRLAELLSLAKLHNIWLEYNEQEYTDRSAFLVIQLENNAAAVDLVSRSILIKDIIELWAVEGTFESMVDSIKSGSQWKRPEYKACSFKFMVQASGITMSFPQQIERIERFGWLGFDGPIEMHNPDAIFAYFEDYGFGASEGVATPQLPLKVYFGLWVSAANRKLVTQYDLKKRGYLGTTSMDAELSLVMANQALAQPGSFILDPFVGTGSFLVSCSHFGAYTFGSDIDGRQIRGTMGKSIETNIDQYMLHSRVLGSLICDIAHHPWRKGAWWDAIVCDPPYGVRAGAKKISSAGSGSTNKSGRDLTHFKENGEPRYPSTEVYEMEDVIVDLVAFAAAYLVPGGRLVFWLPTLNEQYEPQDIPTHPQLVLISNSEQSFGKWSRRLITMEKVADDALGSNDTHLKDLISEREAVVRVNSNEKVPGHARFREKYFGEI
ncbi:hypothetical protein QVD99_001628 [Batrachochytrium dendrobatidis]|nr:hypothetical protein O5D80_000276 [Batrachochytrium dendrobatidis]KAK5671793.1 hypothetical protein QVD99_001628 [Batrachochytrium dendrobatidis]